MTFQYIRRTAVTVAAVIALFVGVPVVYATSYRCTDAKDEAALGADGTVSSSHGNKKCRWSVNGVSFEKQPDANRRIKARTFKALNSLTAGSFNSLFRGSNEVSQFAELLIGPFEGINIPHDTMTRFENAVRNSAEQFARCIKSNGRDRFSERDMFCTEIAPSGDRVIDLWSIEVLPTEQILTMGVTVRDQRYMLFLPVRYLERRIQFR